MDKDFSIGTQSEGVNESAGDPRRAAQRWAILRSAIVKSSSTATRSAQPNNLSAAEGSIHRFEGFGFLRRERLPRSMVSPLVEIFTNLNLHPAADLVQALELSLLAVTALKPAKWTWEFPIQFPNEKQASVVISEAETEKLLSLLDKRLQKSSGETKQSLKLGKGSGWLPKNEQTSGDEDPTISSKLSCVLKIVLAPFLPSQGIYQYILPPFDAEGQEVCKEDNTNSDPVHAALYARERLNTAPTSLRELTSHHHHQGVDNTGNICVWDSEKTMAFSLLKLLAMNQLPWWPQSTSQSPLHILELGAGMAGLAGLALARKLQERQLPFCLFLTDGHPQAVQNNRVHAHMMMMQQSQSFENINTSMQQSMNCLVLPWSKDPPLGETHPPPCHVALVSDCTHFQEFHAHLFFTLAYGVRVSGYVYLCQPHRGKSLQRFLDVVQATANDKVNPLFSVEWLEIPELERKAKSAGQHHHYDPNIHYPRWIMLQKLREVEDRDHCQVDGHMKERDEEAQH